MRLKDLIDKCDIEKVKTHLGKKCFDLSDIDIENHINVLHKIKNIELKNTKYIELVIVIEEVEDDDDFVYYDVSGYDVNKTLEVENSPIPYNGFWGLEFRSWDEWLSMEVYETNIAMFDHDFIVAACLWEMTFIDYNEEQIQKEFKNIKNNIDEIRKNLGD